MKYFITLLSFLLILFLFNYCNGNEFPNPKEENIYLNEPTLSFGVFTTDYYSIFYR